MLRHHSRAQGAYAKLQLCYALPIHAKAAIDPIADSDGGDSKAAIEVITGILARKPGCGPASSCEPYRKLIALELERDRNAMGIWQDLADRHGFAGGYQSVRRFVRNLHDAATPEARVIIETKLGEEAQVDYGTGPMVRDPDSGKYRRHQFESKAELRKINSLA